VLNQLSIIRSNNFVPLRCFIQHKQFGIAASIELAKGDNIMKTVRKLSYIAFLTTSSLLLTLMAMGLLIKLT